MFYEIAERWIENDETVVLHGPFHSVEDMNANLKLLEKLNQDEPVYFTVEGPFNNNGIRI
jgi:hypothetical protein